MDCVIKVLIEIHNKLIETNEMMILNYHLSHRRHHHYYLWRNADIFDRRWPFATIYYPQLIVLNFWMCHNWQNQIHHDNLGKHWRRPRPVSTRTKIESQNYGEVTTSLQNWTTDTNRPTIFTVLMETSPINSLNNANLSQTYQVIRVKQTALLIKCLHGIKCKWIWYKMGE